MYNFEYEYAQVKRTPAVKPVGKKGKRLNWYYAVAITVPLIILIISFILRN